jgi:2-polyprenyl-6-methoxyphenol hydroxylase-like FAD-dependent oxidoreductase
VSDVVEVTPQTRDHFGVPTLKCPHVAGRVALVGDGGTVVRPVTGTGAVKGRRGARPHRRALVRHYGDVDTAVADYNAERFPSA